MTPAQWRILEQAHRKRNIAEYDGELDVSDALLTGMIDAAEDMARRCDALGVPP